MNKIQKAAEFAKLAHEGQVRKYTGEPYFNHCHAVASRVYEYFTYEDMIAAAYLHDVVEDTKYKIEYIFEHFGDIVGEFVYDLTDQFTKENYPHLNRDVRKRLEAERLGKCPALVQVIKCADMWDNTRSIVEHDPGFARVYLKEKAYLVNNLTMDKQMALSIVGNTGDFESLIVGSNPAGPAKC